MHGSSKGPCVVNLRIHFKVIVNIILDTSDLDRASTPQIFLNIPITTPSRPRLEKL
jgi:hypothetical protein